MLDFGFLKRLLAWRRTIVIAMAAAFGISAFASGAGESLDRALREVRDLVRAHPASGEIVIVEIDAKSLQEIDKWPWPRILHAAAIDRLVKVGAQSIAFDVDFSALSRPSDDAKLANALERAGGSVILPTFRQQAATGSSIKIDSVPAKPFINHAFLAAVTVVPDRDGFVRQMPLGVETLGTPRPSLASMLAETRAGIGRFFEIDYSIDPATIPRVSFVDLIRGRVPADRLSGKRVLVGATAIEMGDRYVVPRYGVIPGAVVQALAAETLLEGGPPLQLGALPALALAFVLVGLCAVPISRRLRIAACCAGTAAIFVLPLITEQSFAVSLQIAPALAALAAAAASGAVVMLGERFRSRAFLDPATSLPNLVALEDAAESEEVAMMVAVRIDRFSAIASSLGPEAAVRFVCRVADRLHLANGRGPIYRIDDSCLGWVERSADEATLEDRLEAIAAIMRSPVDCGRLVDAIVNIGVAPAADGGIGQLAANAQLAAVRAARKGLRWQYFAESDSEEANWQLSLLGELDAAMTSGQVWNAYQPKLDLKSGRVVGAETLVRWLHPLRGPIAPDDFIPLVEEHGRARDLTLNTFARALEDAAQWDAVGLSIDIAVNVSATLLADEEFVEQVRQTLASTTIAANRVTMEVTESAAMVDPDKAIPALESWRALGVNISIDDYGTGQSSLGYLQKLPATELKIDKSFVRDINSDERNAIMVRSTIALAHELGIKVVAEGIENEACLKTLTAMGCDTGQGYHIGRPMSAPNLAVFLGGSRIAA